MVKCSFCGKEVKPGHGVIYVTNDNKQYRFCSSKCRKNFFLGRNPRKVKWVKKAKKKKKE